MSAIGAVTGQGIFSELEYKGAKFKVSQWYMDAMDAVCSMAFIKAANTIQLMGGTEKHVAQREVALARTFALGGFNFESIVDDGGLDNNTDLLAMFLWKLLHPNDPTITKELAAEMVREEKQKVVYAVNQANPRIGRLTEKSGQTDQSNAANG